MSLLREHRDEIFAEWQVEAGLFSASLGRDEPALARAMPHLIDDFARILGGERELADSVVNDCAAELLEGAAPLSEFVHELGLLRRSVLHSLPAECSAEDRAEATVLAEWIDLVIERTIDRYLEARPKLVEASGGQERSRALMARERAAAERLRILAGVTRALSEASLDLDRLLDVIAEELTKQVADGCVVYMVTDDARLLDAVACRHTDPTAQALLRQAVSTPIAMGEGFSGRAAATGKTVVLGAGSPEELRALTPSRFEAFYHHVETWALASTPMKVGGRVLGVITVVRDRTSRPQVAAMSAEDRLLVEEIADRAALAIDGARLLVREREAREEAERARTELARAAEFRERFIGIVSHDLRNPLGAIVLATQRLACIQDLPEGFVRLLGRISSAANRMQQMIAELLDLTRGRLGGGIPIVPKRTDLAHIVRRSIEELELASPARHIVLHASGTFEGDYDEARIAQVASNLIGNALQHSPPDTDVEVSLIDRGDAEVALEVKNGGPPIRSELLPHLFEPFVRGTAASSGLGLGLFIVAEIVRAHGGTIGVTSTATHGTTFTVALPRARGSRASSDTPMQTR